MIKIGHSLAYCQRPPVHGGLGLDAAGYYDPAGETSYLTPGLGLTLGQSVSDSVRSFEYQGVPKTIDTMRRMTREAIQRELGAPMVQLRDEILARVRPKDYKSEVAALYYWVLTNVRYIRDPIHVEHVKSPLILLRKSDADVAAGRRAGADDCEAISTVLAALVMASGNQASFITVSTKPGAAFHHVFTVAITPSGERLVVDPVVGPHINEMLGRVVKSQEWKIEPVRGNSITGWTVPDGPHWQGNGAPP